LQGEIHGGFGAVGFVSGKQFAVPARAILIEKNCGAARGLLIAEFPKEARPAVNGSGGETIGTRKPGDCVIGAEGDVKTIEKEVFHEVEWAWEWTRLLTSGQLSQTAGHLAIADEVKINLPVFPRFVFLP
jgi:hypothetical protein